METVYRTRNPQVMSTLCQNLKHNYECQMFCDVTLTTNQSASDNHQSVECHKLVLLSSSLHFKSLLNLKDDQINIIDVSPVSIDVVKEIIGFLYNGECLLHHSTLMETLETSVTWKLPLLTEECFIYMKKFKNMENVCHFYEVSLKHQNINAIYDMSNYIRKHFSKLSEGNHLVHLSLKAFCEIIKSDEVNVETEEVICASAMSLIEKEQSDEDITKCLKLIRYEHLTSDTLFDVALSKPIMKNEPQKSYLMSAHTYQSNKERMQPKKTARLWRRFVYVDKNRWLCEFTGGEKKPLIKIPDWVDTGTSRNTHGTTVLFVSANEDEWSYGRNIMLATFSDRCCFTQLPMLKERTHVAGVLNTGEHIYVMGGKRMMNDTLSRSNAVDRLSLTSTEWETCPPLLEAVVRPLTVMNNKHLFVMEPSTDVTKVQQYNIETSECTYIKDLQFDTFNNYCAALFYKNRLTLVSSDQLMSYEQESDTWSVKEYDDLGEMATALIVDGELCTCIEKDEKHFLLSYNEEDNMWNVKIADIPDMLDNRYCFMVAHENDDGDNEATETDTE